jgi:hypothetical protein
VKATGKPPFSVKRPAAIRHNRRARTGDYIALGITDGGRRIMVIFSFTDENGVRPIAAWERE